MVHKSIARGALMGTALTLSLAGLARAETEIVIHEDQVAGLSDNCVVLVEAIQGNNNMVPDDAEENILMALNNNDAQECAQLSEAMLDPTAADTQAADAEMVEEETDTEMASETEVLEDTEVEREQAEVTEQTTVQEEAVVEGVARVTVPEPEVDVEVDPPEVTVRKAQPEVSITEQAAEIELRQEQPNVTVQIPEIIVQVDIPAPSIFIRTDEPSVEVAAGDPQIEVQQSEPRVTVRQPEPELAVDLDVDEEADMEATETADVDATGGATEVDGDVTTERDAPVVRMVEAEGEPTVRYQAAQAKVNYEGAQPNVSVEFTQEPTVQISQVGQPTVTYETTEEREQRRQAEAEGVAVDGDTQMAATDGEAMLENTEEELAEAGNTVEEGVEEELAEVDNALDGAGDEMAAAEGEELPEAGTLAATDEANVDGVNEDIAATNPLATDEAPMADEQMAETDMAAAGDVMTVGDLLVMEVVDVNGEGLGSPDAFIETGNGVAMVVSTGGFLGLGDTQVAIPMDHVSIQNGAIVLQTMTEEEIENSRDIDFQNGAELDAETQVRLN
jgi:hypothetical protein